MQLAGQGGHRLRTGRRRHRQHFDSTGNTIIASANSKAAIEVPMPGFMAGTCVVSRMFGERGVSWTTHANKCSPSGWFQAPGRPDRQFQATQACVITRSRSAIRSVGPAQSLAAISPIAKTSSKTSRVRPEPEFEQLSAVHVTQPTTICPLRRIAAQLRRHRSQKPAETRRSRQLLPLIRPAS